MARRTPGAILVVSLALVAGHLGPAVAAPPPDDAVAGHLGGGDALVDGLHRSAATATSGRASSPGGPGTSATSLNAPEPQYTYQWVIACAGNAPGDPTNTLCGLAATGCGPGELLRWLFRAPVDTAGAVDGTWLQVGSQCLTDAEAAAGVQPAAFPGVTNAEFRALPLPPGGAHVEPGNGYVLINVPTNVYVTAATVTLPTTVVGVAVQVRATPATYTWDFGDGSTIGPTTATGAPYPDLQLTHTYTTAVRAGITLTTTYTGEYSVAGGPFLPIDGTASVTSPAVAVAVLSGHPALVADPLTSPIP